MREFLRGRFARRLALAFATLGAGAALLTAVLVNLAFGARFDDYRAAQQQIRQQQLVAMFAAEYTPADGWNRQKLNELAPTVTMTGSQVELRAPDGTQVWSLADADVDDSILAMHRDMMGVGDLGPPQQLPVVVDGRQVGILDVRVPQGPIPAVDRTFRSDVNKLLIAGGLTASVIALGVGVYTARRATAPIAELTHAAADLADGRKDRRVTRIPDNEIGLLATTFNTMADRIEREEELRRLFAADVAHELRTPLAILRSELEAVQDGVREPTPAVISSLHEETLRMGRLIADLETLASADAAAFTLQRRTLSLTDLVASTVEDFRERFSQAGITLNTELAEVFVDGDDDRLRQIITNQLTNALKFVPPDGTVTVTVERLSGWAELRVSDTGPGIPDSDLPHIFDRFFRSRTARADGSGIGLSVAKELATAHGGTITATSAPGRGTTFTTRLPGVAVPSAEGLSR
ncbi:MULTISPECIES: ATP-binding protein [Nocardia]